MSPEGNLSGPSLDALVDEITDWYVQQRKLGIELMTSGSYPYGSAPISLDEQYARYKAMTPQQWQFMRATLYNIHRGEPDAVDLVERDVQRYISIMENIGGRINNARL